MKQPMQPVVLDDQGVIRFQKNAIVETLLDYCSERGLSLNELALMVFSEEDRIQFAQLLGYSVSGFHELRYVTDAAAAAASEAARQILPGVAGCRDEGCPIHRRGEPR